MRFRGLGVAASVSLVIYGCLAVALFLVSPAVEKTAWTDFVFRLIFFVLLYLIGRAFPSRLSDDAPSPRLTVGRVAVFVVGFFALLTGFMFALYTYWADHVTGTILSLIACVTIFCDVLEKRWLKQDEREREKEREWFRSKGIRC